MAATHRRQRIAKRNERLRLAEAVCEAYVHSADSPIGSVARDSAILELDNKVKAYLAAKENDDG